MQSETLNNSKIFRKHGLIGYTKAKDCPVIPRIDSINALRITPAGFTLRHAGLVKDDKRGVKSFHTVSTFFVTVEQESTVASVEN